jgi:hypothetical protein
LGQGKLTELRRVSRNSVHLGFEPVKKYKFWEKGFEGGPLQLSADGGKSMIALFVATTDHPMPPQTKGIAFNTDIENFMNFGTSPLTELTVH